MMNIWAFKNCSLIRVEFKEMLGDKEHLKGLVVFMETVELI